jgi:hypothetical protein
MRHLLLLFIAFGTGVVHAKLPELIPYRKGELWGYCDSTKTIVIEPQWREAGFFHGGSARVLARTGFGLVDQTGAYLQQPVYEWIDEEPVHGLRSLCSTDPEANNGMVDVNGKIVIPLIHPWIHWEGALLEAQRPGCRIGVYDTTGRVVIPFRYKACGDIPASMGDSGMFAMCKRGKWGVIDTAGKIIIPFRYDWIEAVETSALYWSVYTASFDCHYYSSRGVYLGDSLKPYSLPMPPVRPVFVNGRRPFRAENGLFGFQDEQYHEVIAPRYPVAEHFNAYDLAYVAIRKGRCDICFIYGYVGKDGTEYWDD